MTTESSGIETYSVGLLMDWDHLWIRIRYNPREFIACFRLFFKSWARSWRRKSYWNGYLTEWHYRPFQLKTTRCGHGWTKRRSQTSLGRHIVSTHMIKERGTRGKHL